MADTPTRTDTPPPPPKPPDQSLKPSPEMQQKLDDFRAQKEARQDAAVETGERPQAKHARPETAGEYTGPERREHGPQHLDPAAGLRNRSGEQKADSGSGERPHGDHYRHETGTGLGPWSDEGTNYREGEAVQQITKGSCVSAAGEMLTDGRVSQEQFYAQLGDMPDPMRLRDNLNERDGGGWKGSYFATGEDAVNKASEGPMAAVLQVPKQPGHMVMLEPRPDGTFNVRDPWEGKSYDVNSNWIDKYVSAGVWPE